MNNKKFFTTREKKGPYKFLVPAAKLHSEKIINENLDFYLYKHKRISLKSFFFISKIIFSGKIFFTKNLININYRGYNLSRYALPEVYKNFKSYLSKSVFYYELIKSFYWTSMTVDDALSTKDVKTAFIDHGMYRNGLLIEIFSKRNILIFTLGYPRGFFFISHHRKNKINYENIIQLNKLKKINNIQANLAKKTITKIISKTEKFPWMRNIKFKDNLEIDLKDITHVVYVHTFTDTQMIYGYDGFLNVYEWFNFTINELTKNKKNKILVKAHPCFFHEKFPNKNAEYDRKLFFQVTSKYLKNKQILILKEPIRNKKLLEKISKKTILISHHGSVVLESLFIGFKIIASSAAFWNKDFKLANKWKNIPEYKTQLKKNWSDLEFCNKSDLLNVSYQLFCLPNGIYGKKHWESILINELKISKSMLFETAVKTLQKAKLSDVNLNKIIKLISKTIEFIETKKD